ncbi:hypothetical protein FQR65_LT06715 [Abscondita terminalis]|nr:hypothetical protein FQR65_LT06715 [Abscondita terminalis]
MQFHAAALGITLILASLVCSEIFAISCGNICKDAQCKTITECPPGQTLKPAGYCLCCLDCVSILQMNEKCPGLTFLMGVPPSLQQCAEGLSCINGVCRPSISMITRF